MRNTGLPSSPDQRLINLFHNSVDDVRGFNTAEHSFDVFIYPVYAPKTSPTGPVNGVEFDVDNGQARIIVKTIEEALRLGNELRRQASLGEPPLTLEQLRKSRQHCIAGGYPSALRLREDAPTPFPVSTNLQRLVLDALRVLDARLQHITVIREGSFAAHVPAPRPDLDVLVGSTPDTRFASR